MERNQQKPADDMQHKLLCGISFKVLKSVRGKYANVFQAEIKLLIYSGISEVYLERDEKQDTKEPWINEELSGQTDYQDPRILS